GAVGRGAAAHLAHHTGGIEAGGGHVGLLWGTPSIMAAPGRRGSPAPATLRSRVRRARAPPETRLRLPAPYLRCRRQARWIRGLRAKSGGIVSPLMSSQRANCATASSSRRKRR